VGPARRIIAWLSKPVEYRPGPPDEFDPRRLGRSFGRTVGGNVNLGGEPPDSPAVQAWRRGAGGATRGPGHPRWMELLLFAMAAILVGVVVAILVVVETH
jgi:hypothetical protein